MHLLVTAQHGQKSWEGGILPQADVISTRNNIQKLEMSEPRPCRDITHFCINFCDTDLLF